MKIRGGGGALSQIEPKWGGGAYEGQYGIWGSKIHRFFPTLAKKSCESWRNINWSKGFTRKRLSEDFPRKYWAKLVITFCFVWRFRQISVLLHLYTGVMVWSQAKISLKPCEPSRYFECIVAPWNMKVNRFSTEFTFELRIPELMFSFSFRQCKKKTVSYDHLRLIVAY